MSGGSKKRGGSRGGKEEADEVETLLRSAEDELLLGLTVNSHSTRLSSSLPPDLHRRFQALLSSHPRHHPPRHHEKGASGHVEDDLLARFAALKGSGPASGKNDSISSNDFISGEKSGDEVEEVMRWAVDTARLDPSDGSDDDDDVDDDSDSEEEDDDFDRNKEKKVNKKNKNKL